MPLRAFGDFTFKWPIDQMKKAGLVQAFGAHVIHQNYKTPPYLIAEPEITTLPLNSTEQKDRFLLLATDGLWEQFEMHQLIGSLVGKHKYRSSNLSNKKDENNEDDEKIEFEFGEGSKLREIRDAIKAHWKPPSLIQPKKKAVVDMNCCTYLLRKALGMSPEIAELESDERERQSHIRLASYLSLPDSVVRNFRDDISMVLIRLN